LLLGPEGWIVEFQTGGQLFVYRQSERAIQVEELPRDQALIEQMDFVRHIHQ
jgi:hypothetical protein